MNRNQSPIAKLTKQIMRETNFKWSTCKWAAKSRLCELRLLKINKKRGLQ